MSYCVTGIAPPPPKEGLVPVRTLRPDTVLYAGIRCHDGRPITASRLFQEAIRLGCTIRRAKPSAPTPVAAKGMLLTTFAAPTTLSHVLGHKSEIAVLKDWLAAWPRKGRAVLLVGPPGIGKTTTAHLLAKEYDYAVTEWNASDARTVAALQSLRLEQPRIRRELLVMDEVDGLAEQGGCAELASLLPRTALPVICITNTLPPKLAALQKATTVIKFHRPMKSTIAQWMQGVAKARDLPIPPKAELEAACEANGNDIRALLNAMDFRRTAPAIAANKDPQLDLFAATTRLLGRPHAWKEMEDLVYVDHGMVPLMVHEAVVAASRTIEEAAEATEEISWGDPISKVLWRTQDWSLLPLAVASTIMAARKRTGSIPFQIFPRVLGKMSAAAKGRRWMTEAGQGRRLSGAKERLEEVEWIQKIVARTVESGTKAAIQETIQRMEAMGLTREHIGNMGEVLFAPVEIATKTKTALTREYNKKHVKTGSMIAEDQESEDEDD